MTDGIESALRQAKEAAGEKPVLIAGGANTVNQYLAAGLIDELWLHIAPVTVGKGCKLFEGVTHFGMEPTDHRSTKFVTHIKYKKYNCLATFLICLQLHAHAFWLGMRDPNNHGHLFHASLLSQKRT